jgi:hypothetical protein
LLENDWIKKNSPQNLCKNSLIVVEFKTSKDLKNFSSENFELLDLRSWGRTSFGFLQLKS